MKKLFGYILIIFIASNCVLQAQWVQTNGPYGDIINGITAVGTTVLAGSNNGLFMSTNDGTNWNSIKSGIFESFVISDNEIGSTNIFAVSTAYIYLSTDRGISWNALNNLNNGFPNDPLTCLAVNGTNFFVGTQEIGVYMSSNNGTSWVPTSIGGMHTYSRMNAIAAHGSDVVVGTDVGIYISNNNGSNWKFVKNEYVFSLAIMPNGTGRNNIFAGTYSDGVFFSTDEGVTWNSVNEGLSNKSVWSLEVNGTDVYAGTNTGVFLSTNNGISWSTNNNELRFTSVQSLFVNSNLNGDSQLFAGTSEGIFLSTNKGMNWTPINNGIGYLPIGAFALNGKSIYAGTYNSSGAIYSSDNNGLSWTALNFNNYAGSYDVYLSADSDKTGGINLFAGTDNGIFLSSNNGSTWTNITNNLSNKTVTSIASIQISTGDRNLFAGTYGDGVFLSTNNGLKWAGINSGLEYNSIHCLAVDETNLFAGTEDTQAGVSVFLSTNNGTNWVKIYNNNSISTIYTIKVFDTNIFIGTSQGIYLSTNNGTKWSDINNGFPSKTNVYCLEKNGTNLYAGTYGKGVFLSTDYGSTWTAVNNGLKNNTIHTLCIKDSMLFAGTDHGVWSCPLSEIITDVGNKQNNLPMSFSLQQNYPNPFNPTTTINYSVPKSGIVKIKVYDLLGRVVATLVNENKPIGNYSVQLNAAKLVSGIYFYRMESGSFSQTKKLLLLK